MPNIETVTVDDYFAFRLPIDVEGQKKALPVIYILVDGNRFFELSNLSKYLEYGGEALLNAYLFCICMNFMRFNACDVCNTPSCTLTSDSTAALRTLDARFKSIYPSTNSLSKLSISKVLYVRCA